MMLSFNSILVRLKVFRPSPDKVNRILFQFHTGSIKRTKTRISEVKSPLFQFHTGSIKSVTVNCKLNFVSKFQFHTGSIKRVLTNRCKPSFESSFNSILVRLKGHLKRIIQLHKELFQFHTGSIKRSRLLKKNCKK